MDHKALSHEEGRAFWVTVITPVAVNFKQIQRQCIFTMGLQVGGVEERSRNLS
jgi:hypothetical protein